MNGTLNVLLAVVGTVILFSQVGFLTTLGVLMVAESLGHNQKDLW